MDLHLKFLYFFGSFLSISNHPTGSFWRAPLMNEAEEISPHLLMNALLSLSATAAVIALLYIAPHPLPLTLARSMTHPLGLLDTKIASN